MYKLQSFNKQIKSISCLRHSAHSINRNMVLQDESNDEEIEHFEDIIEEPEVKAETGPSKQPENTVENDHHNNLVEADGDVSSDSEVKEGSVASDSDGSDGEADLLGGASLNGAVKVVETTSVSGKEQPRPSKTWSSLPGGYDPRHREPSYWYFPVYSLS